MFKWLTVLICCRSIRGLLACLLFTGCVASMEQAKMSYRSMAGYDAPELTVASSGWLLVNRSSGDITLTTPSSIKTSLQVTHYLKVWWHPGWKFVLAQNNYRQHTPLTVSKQIRSNLQFTRHFNGIVGQSVYLLDLENQRGLVNYTVYYEQPPMFVMNQTPESGGISVYPDPDDFFADTDVKALLFREFSYESRGLERGKNALFKHQDRWFSFGKGSGLWQPFLDAARLNGTDSGRWAQWNAREFFVQRLQLQLPGVYVEDNSIELTGMGSDDIFEKLLLSSTSGAFSMTTEPLLPTAQTRLNGYRKQSETERHNVPGSMTEQKLYGRIHELLWLK